MVRRFKQETGGQHLAQKLAFPEPLRQRRVPVGGALIGTAIVALCALAAWHGISGDRLNLSATPETPSPAPVAAPPDSAPSSTGTAGIAEAPAEALSKVSPAAGGPSPAASHGMEVLRALRSEPLAPPTASAGAGAATSEPSTAPAHVLGVVGDEHFRIALRVTAKTWLEVKDGNTSIFKGLLEPGDEYRLPDRPGLTLHIGNAHGIEVLADGKPLPSAAQPSQGHRTVVTLEARDLLASAGQQ